MAVATQITPTPVSITVTGLSTLAASTFVASGDVSAVVSGNLVDRDNIIEVTAGTTNTPTGGLQLSVYCQASWDGGANFESGPTTGTDATNEPELVRIGAVQFRSSGTKRKSFSIAQHYGGNMPKNYRLVFRNELGAALTSASVTRVRITDDVT